MIILGSRSITNSIDEFGLWTIKLDNIKIETVSDLGDENFFLNLNYKCKTNASVIRTVKLERF